MNNKISVVVTCYNHEEYINECLESIFVQTYPNIELLVINDGSTDNSGMLIEQQLRHSPFKQTTYLNDDNVGLVAARNKAFALINGEFVLFVDSDNFLESDYLETLLTIAEKENADIIYSKLVNAETNELYLDPVEFDLQTELNGNFIDSCSLIRVSKIGDVRYDMNLNRKKLEDYDFFLNLIINNDAKPVKAHNTQLNYRVLEDSLSRKASEKDYFEVYLYILSKYYKQQPDRIEKSIYITVMTLESRLSDVTFHFKKALEIIHGQEKKIEDQEIEAELFKKKIVEFQALKKNIMAERKQLNSKIKELEQTISSRNLQNELLLKEKNAILNSTSYKVGHFVVKPLYYTNKLLKNPRLTRQALVRIKQAIIFRLNKLPNIKGRARQIMRIRSRNNNNYVNPNRVLIYVIYESKDTLQEYKLVFLQALAKMSKKVLIVVNGNLPESDLKKLSLLGQVEIRSNSGYDTAAFKHGVKKLGRKGLSKYDELMLVNDTNVGPMSDLQQMFSKMAERKLDFWGISYGEPQGDFTGYNRYGRIPIHLQSYFLVIEKSMFNSPEFLKYWNELGETTSREKAIGKHETVFTKYFEDLGFSHGAVAKDYTDSAMYIHPLSILQEGIPIVKYTAFANYDSEQFAWQGLKRESEVPALLNFIENKTNYPMDIINQIMKDVHIPKANTHILIIDGVENKIPQCTRYRVLNKAEQLRSLGYTVWTVNASTFRMAYAWQASHIIIYRTGYNEEFAELVRLAKKAKKPIYYDIDDLVIDTKYTDQLEYTKTLPKNEKAAYDAGVESYGMLMKLCDGVITTTEHLQQELLGYQKNVLINRNLASKELVEISEKAYQEKKSNSTVIKIGYFSGSITHNENFELIEPAITQLLAEYQNLELHLVGHLEIPKELDAFKRQVVIHEYVEWHELPKLISEVDINLAPLVNTTFNNAKSEIKWIEASLVKVVTVASNVGAFKEMIQTNITGILVEDNYWYETLREVICSNRLRKNISEKASEYVLENCVTSKHEDQLNEFLRGKYDENSNR